MGPDVFEPPEGDDGVGEDEAVLGVEDVGSFDVESFVDKEEGGVNVLGLGQVLGDLDAAGVVVGGYVVWAVEDQLEDFGADSGFEG